ncbi:GNAT family N-acetyltransferase [Enterococcus sp. BWB1-3]|uniref:GNAT family N-acetyltransferase n=1 Tax=unclassified Enterococcus TaxID=2608891 RepID=UPI001922275D|nr:MULTISPECIES: GNAT family N-acetyltransferase [unclassified Enterococcus]MBL1229455.1 GNAT family N-acetyltransferase [Enterococcus sp. BWB1-3]MCB5952627.1 GNAT family N-acetyltransferase [Enterococcus sp. BWT-B8]MCB5956316.1 GNAT family N-acetyltransferase [Enterococcus sp. CWB-B31]
MKLHFGNERWNQAAAFALRYEVFVKEQHISVQEEFDSLDTPDRKYFVLYDGKEAVGTVRYEKAEDEIIQPDRLCVEENNRRKGIGTKLMNALEEKAVKDGCTTSTLSAEISVVPFYEKLGYTKQSGTFLEDNILCVKMSKELPVEE